MTEPLTYRPNAVYLRDASWHNGVATVYHWPRPDDPALARCSRQVVIGTPGRPYPSQDPAEVSASMRCHRAGCQIEWANWEREQARLHRAAAADPERCNSRWWRNGVPVARCYFTAGHQLDPDPSRRRHHNGSQWWNTFDNRWRTYTEAEMVELLRALVVRPPWAWAIAWAGKGVENRAQPTSYRGAVVIVAGKTLDADCRPRRDSTRYPQETLLWDAAKRRREGEDLLYSSEAWKARGAALCVVDLVDCHRGRPGCCDSLWAEAGTQWPYHWVLEDVRRLSPLLDVRGNLGLRRPTPELADAVGAQLAA